MGVGLHPDFPTAVKEMTRVGDTFEPNPDAHAMYDELYNGVYLKLYGRLRPLYEAMRGKR